MVKLTEEEYDKNPKYCKYCGKKIDYRRMLASFCNNSCAASFNNKKRGKLSQSHKNNISKGLLKSDKIKEIKIQNKIKKLTKCKVCGKLFYNLPGKHRKTCSNECLTELRKINGKKIIQKEKEKGVFKGWQSRNITSYPEKFFIKVLKLNNISFEREFLIKIDNTKYFLDFRIVKNDRIIDLEIDGKQHLYPDRIVHDKKRDEDLIKNGYEVYRIPWNNINTENGKKLMKKKIDNFIIFLNK